MSLSGPKYKSLYVDSHLEVKLLVNEAKIVEHGLPGKFDYLEHTADVYILAYGENIIELLENAGIALFETMTDTNKINKRIYRDIEAHGIDLENLLYRWLEELLTIYYSENIMCSEIRVNKFVVSRENNEIDYFVKGLCMGEEFDPERHEAKVEVKAITYHLMKIIREENGWKAYFVLDI